MDHSTHSPRQPTAPVSDLSTATHTFDTISCPIEPSSSNNSVNISLKHSLRTLQTLESLERPFQSDNHINICLQHIAAHFRPHQYTQLALPVKSHHISPPLPSRRTYKATSKTLDKIYLLTVSPFSVLSTNLLISENFNYLFRLSSSKQNNYHRSEHHVQHLQQQPSTTLTAFIKQLPQSKH